MRDARRVEQEAGHALEAAADVLAVHDRLDLVDRRGVARGREPRLGLTVQPFDLDEPIVDRAAEMGSGHRRHASRERAVVEEHDGVTVLHEQVRGGEARNAAADHAHVGRDVLVERRAGRHVEHAPW